MRWVPDAGTRRLYLSPSYFTRPYNYVFGGRDWHMFAYPLAEAALDGDRGAVPAASVRLFKALGDESRLRILNLLASGDLYLTEIADRMGLSKPTVSHHLALLRAAGLVTITEAGALTYYSLRRDRIADAGLELDPPRRRAHPVDRRRRAPPQWTGGQRELDDHRTEGRRDAHE